MSDSDFQAVIFFGFYFIVFLYTIKYYDERTKKSVEKMSKKSKKAKNFNRDEGDNGASLMQLLDEDDDTKVNL